MPTAGWYPDPSGTPNTLRYWDGTQWTASTRPGNAAAAPAVPQSDPAAQTGGYVPQQGSSPQEPTFPPQQPSYTQPGYTQANYTPQPGFAPQQGAPLGQPGYGFQSAGYPGPMAPAPKKANPALIWGSVGALVVVLAIVAGVFLWPRGGTPVTPSPTLSPTPTTTPTFACPEAMNGQVVSDGYVKITAPSGWTDNGLPDWAKCGAMAVISDKPNYFYGSIGVGSMASLGSLADAAKQIWANEVDKYYDSTKDKATVTSSGATKVQGVDAWQLKGTVDVTSSYTGTDVIEVTVLMRPDGRVSGISIFAGQDDTTTLNAARNAVSALTLG